MAFFVWLREGIRPPMLPMVWCVYCTGILEEEFLSLYLQGLGFKHIPWWFLTTKVAGVNSRDRNFNAAKLAERIAAADARITGYIAALTAADAAESGSTTTLGKDELTQDRRASSAVGRTSAGGRAA